MAEPNFVNRTLFHGDNLPFLRALNSESVHLIATDPPFNKGRDFHATPDSLAAGAKFQDRWSWEDDVEGEWVDQITDGWPRVMTVINGSRESYGDDMGAFLCFMAVRLIEMRRVLRSDGSIYLHCDPTASHYLKQLMDVVFGKDNLRNEIIWHYGLGGFNVRNWFPRKHDTIFYYAKSPQSHHNKIRGAVSKWMDAKYSQVDEKGRYFVQDGTRYYLKGGKPIDSVWDNDELIDCTLSQTDSERTGYPTQKPLALYERIISASSNPGDIVLDPFAGCATTPIAAERLGRLWVAMDIWEGAYTVAMQRMEDNRQLLADPAPQIHYVMEPPQRTDDAEGAVPFLQVTERSEESTPRRRRPLSF